MGLTEETQQSQVPLGLLTPRSLSPDAGRGADAEREGGPAVRDALTRGFWIIGGRPQRAGGAGDLV